MNIIEIKQVLNDLNLEFVRLNKKTIQNIKKYQEQNGEDPTPITEHQTKIVMKKLIIKNKRKI